MKPWEFWRLTPAQYHLLAEAYYRRVRRRREIEANWICTIVNSYPMRGRGSKSLRPEQLIGPSPEQVKALQAKAKAARAARKKP